ncbi:hypothetical protein M408DRAFT_329206 [Serendipita vermifera MAFF 305830]|uniref:Uncharacterized protein n=1 Tax=Serendipita vermifera MAFF 305830 TaxID=933852 RepID=A0A0C3BBB0_SERVB|nr:hypothetical protein M408DRAFT_329206 [Serendipita vermifera MAFF 305830]
MPEHISKERAGTQEMRTKDLKPAGGPETSLSPTLDDVDRNPNDQGGDEEDYEDDEDEDEDEDEHSANKGGKIRGKIRKAHTGAIKGQPPKNPKPSTAGIKR